MSADKMGGFADGLGLRGTLFHPTNIAGKAALEVFSRLFEVHEIELGPYKMTLMSSPMLPENMFALIDGRGEFHVFRLDLPEEEASG